VRAQRLNCGVHSICRATRGGTLIVDATQLTEASVTFAVDHANGFDLGPITLAPVASWRSPQAHRRKRLASGLAGRCRSYGALGADLNPPSHIRIEPTGQLLTDDTDAACCCRGHDIALSTRR